MKNQYSIQIRWHVQLVQLDMNLINSKINVINARTALFVDKMNPVFLDINDANLDNIKYFQID
jgi:hypothetical protein